MKYRQKSMISSLSPRKLCIFKSWFTWFFLNLKLKVFNIQSSFDIYSTLFENYENSSIYRLENMQLIILLTKQYIIKTKMWSSRPNAKVLKNVCMRKDSTKVSFCLYETVTILIITIIGKFCFKTWKNPIL